MSPSSDVPRDPITGNTEAEAAAIHDVTDRLLLLAERGVVATVPEFVARRFHEVYEALAPVYGYRTRPESAVRWEDVPESNRRLMTATAATVVEEFAGAFFPRRFVAGLQPEPLEDVAAASKQAGWPSIHYQAPDIGCTCPDPEMAARSGHVSRCAMRTGVAVVTGRMLIDHERRRQVDVEGYDRDHDKAHGPDKLIRAGLAYKYGDRNLFPRDWVWKPKTALRDLIRAGALFAAALDVSSDDRRFLYGAERAAAERDKCAELIDDLIADVLRVIGGR